LDALFKSMLRHLVTTKVRPLAEFIALAKDTQTNLEEVADGD